jgi:elongator complex protein 3
MTARTSDDARETAQEPPERSSQATRAFEPAHYRDQLIGIIRDIERVRAEGGRALGPGALDAILRKYPRDGEGFFSRAQLIAGFRHFAGCEGFGLDEESFLENVRRRPVRTQSGVAPLTLLTKPFPCPGRCIFCPSDLDMPKSYLSDEPGAQRAAANDFNPYLQTWNRLAALRAIGHPTEKIELIVLGGTWSFYPEPYQVWFARRCFEAMNDFGRGVDRRDEARSLAGREDPEAPLADWAALGRAQRDNETASCRSVGFCVETRPDCIGEAEVVRMRRLGCTKVQLGLQSLSDEILAANHRGHDVATTRVAMALLRRAGFKIHAHWMPNLLGATPESDVEDFARVFDDPDFRPDELKVYPCSLIEGTELMGFFESGQWRPYTHAELLEVLTTVLSRVPGYCRLTRVVRDISSDDIVAGNKLTNFRQIAEEDLARRGGRCRDIRAREIRSQRFDVERLSLGATEYESGIGRELFLEFTAPGDHIVGFLRLALPAGRGHIKEIATSALIREVHVYGGALPLGERSKSRAQHRGLGVRLIDEAARRAREAGFSDLAVISAVGTRPYYRRLGFTDGRLYQHRSLT